MREAGSREEEEQVGGSCISPVMEPRDGSATH